MKHQIPAMTLSNGVKMPAIGFGTWMIQDGEDCVRTVREALDCGYRHIDTAWAYGNEASVGRAIRESGVDRQDVFITSKVAPEDCGYERTLQAFEASMQQLELDYLDLYLIHWPSSPSKTEDWETLNLSTWRGLMELYLAGRIRAIGVSNFWPHHLSALLQTKIPPMVNQIETHPGVYHREVIQYCVSHGIQVEGYSPFGRSEVLNNPTLGVIARKHGRTPAQVCLRWAHQLGVVPLPKSVHRPRMEENLDIWDFSLSQEEMNHISDLPYCGGKNHHPDRR